MSYKFKFEGKEYDLNEEKLVGFFNDEENEILGIDENKIFEMLNNSTEVDFEKTYYKEVCENCLAGKEENKKVFDYLEYYFYVYSKDGNYVASNISNEYDGLSFTRLERQKIVDTSYIVTITVCAHCGEFTIEIEKFEL